MYKGSAHAFRVGLMVAIGLSVLAVALILIPGDFQPFRPRYILTIIFNYVAGLEVNSPVRLSGMEVGGVKGMHVREGKIHVVIRIDREARIRQDAIATINSMGLIGEKYLALTPGESGPYLESGAVIIGKDPVSIGEMLSRGEEIVHKAEGVVKTVDKVLSEAEIVEDIEKVLKNIESFSANLDGLIRENRKEISDSLRNLSKSSREFRETSEELKVATREISSRLKRIFQELDQGFEGKGEDIEEIITDLKGVSNRLSSSAKSLEGITRQIGKGEGVAGKLLYDKEMADNLSVAIKNLRELTEDIEAHPWKLMRKK